LLGIEAGGTRTVALLANLHGQLIQRLEAGPANLKLLSDAELVRHFRSLARALPRPAAIGIGIAGARTETDRARLRETVRIAWGRLPVRVSADLETALAAAGESRGGAAQVLVLCGTGSCCFGQRHGDRSVRVGGWGHILGDQGSGFDIAMRALRAVIAEFDRLGRWPRLGQRLLRELLLNEPNDLIPWAQAAPKQEVARLAAEVFAAWHEGDRLAAVVVRGAADALVQDALECARKLAGRRERVRFVFAGGVLLRQPRFAALLRAALQKARPGSTAEVLSRESAWGAVELAKRALTEAGRSASRTTDRRGLGTPTSLPLLPTATGASPTESRNPRSLGLDKLSVSAAVRLMIA
jgi:N-acetylglucosamine kinase-like BadF-type ATPase